MSSVPGVWAGRPFFVAFREYVLLSQPPRRHHFYRARPAQMSSKTPYIGKRCYATSPSINRKESLRPQTYYEFFPASLPSGPPPQGPFAIDVRGLRKEYLQLQAQAHPDRHQGEDKARAEGASARINEAYKTLQNPLLRAQYLLSLRGIDVAEDETAKVEDPELLMEVLEMREEIESIRIEEDLAPLKEANNAKIKKSVEVLDRAFKVDDLDLAKQETVRLRYWINIKDSLDAWEKGKPVVLVH